MKPTYGNQLAEHQDWPLLAKSENETNKPTELHLSGTIPGILWLICNDCPQQLERAWRSKMKFKMSIDTCVRDGKSSKLELKVLMANSIHLHVPLALFLQFFNECFVIQSFALGHSLQHILDSRHHASKPTKIHVRALVQAIE